MHENTINAESSGLIYRYHRDRTLDNMTISYILILMMLDDFRTFSSVDELLLLVLKIYADDLERVAAWIQTTSGQTQIAVNFCTILDFYLIKCREAETQKRS